MQGWENDAGCTVAALEVLIHTPSLFLFALFTWFLAGVAEGMCGVCLFFLFDYYVVEDGVRGTKSSEVFSGCVLMGCWRW
jgi:hypothetical protein